MKPFDFMNEKYHMGHLFLDSVRSNPDAINQINAATGESETNGSVLRRSVQLARCFRRWGTKPGDVLALGGRNHLDIHIPYFAALLNGMPIAGIDPQFKYTEIKAFLKLATPKIVFCQIERLEDHLKAINELELDTKVICFDEGDYSLKKFIEENDDGKEDKDFAPLDFDLNNIYAWLVSTGGTTGILKLAAFTHKSFLAKLMELMQLFGAERSKEADSASNEYKASLNLSPVQWISSYFNALCMPLMKQIKVMTSAPDTAEHIVDIINKYKPVSTTLGPSLAISLIKSKKHCDFTCFNDLVLAGSKIHKDVIVELRKRLRQGAEVKEVYGQTENLGPILTPNPKGPIGNCGTIPYKFHRVKLMDPETGKEIKEPNVPGEMWTKGTCFTEYYKNPEETAKAFSEDGWYKTGDILYLDEEGNYFFVERIKMLIKCRNYHIVPPEIEAVIRQHPGVHDVNVTSIPNEDDGEHAVACVVRNNGANVTAQEIKDLVDNQLSESQKLRGGVVFMDELPMLSTGKVARAKLRQMVLTANRE